MSNPQASALKQRHDYVYAFNTTMVNIWLEQISKLGVVDTGRLARSVQIKYMTTDDKIREISMGWQFAEYGIYQDRGTGREVPKGNSGDIGHAKIRERRKWFSTKFYASFMRIREFFADNLGEEFSLIIPVIMGKSSR